VAGIEDIIRQRIQEQLDARDQQRRGTFEELGAIKNILGGQGGGYQPGPSVYGQMAQQPQQPTQQPGMAAPPGGGQQISPEDYQYYVDIEKRDVYGEPEIDPETGMPMKQKPLGWDKSVKRYAKRAKTEEAREPSMGDLSSDSMRERDARGRFSRKMQQGNSMEDFFGG